MTSVSIHLAICRKHKGQGPASQFSTFRSVCFGRADELQIDYEDDLISENDLIGAGTDSSLQKLIVRQVQNKAESPRRAES